MWALFTALLINTRDAAFLSTRICPSLTYVPLFQEITVASEIAHLLVEDALGESHFLQGIDAHQFSPGLQLVALLPSVSPAHFFGGEEVAVSLEGHPVESAIGTQV